MPFQRSYSKVWWGSDDNHTTAINPANQHSISLTSGGLYSYFKQQAPTQAQPQQQQQQHRQPFFYHHQSQQQQFGGTAYHSLDLNQYKSYGGNLSRIQEVEDEHNISKISWEKHDSPGSLRSQDSGFSDNDEFHSLRSLSGRSSKASTPSSKSNRSAKSDMDSPNSTRTVATPPTVIRRTGNSEFYAPLVNVSRRISFSSATSTPNKQEPDEGSSLLDKLDSMQLLTESPVAKKLDFNDSNGTQSSDANSPIKGHNPRVKKRRKVQRKPTSPLSPAYKRWQKLNDQMEEEEEANENQKQDKELNSSGAKEYNNETVYLGAGTPTCCTPPPPYNNETVILGGNNSSLNLDPHGVSPLRLETRFNGNTSTPKLYLKATTTQACTLPPLYSFNVYDNTLLNGHTEDIQHWLDDLRMSYDHEVMSTLQTKSIAQEAFKNLQITTNTVAKFIRQLQQKALPLQTAFEKVERMLSGIHDVTLSEAITSSLQLLNHVQEFTYVLERRSCSLPIHVWNDYLDQIRMVNKDTRYSLDNQHYINLESLLETCSIEAHMLITIKQVYERLVRILVLSIENGRCDLMLKANINMIATLMNIDYDGFASLTNAFVQTEAVRTLLVVCLDHKLSSVRAQALRALATICCAPEPIAQLGACGGVEIIRDILQVSGGKKPQNDIQRGDMEKREAVSLLTQITAAWHGPEHKVSGIKACVETIVEGLTQLLVFTECPQTLLLCTAALNNLSRMEITAHYSIMSHETIFKLITTMEERDKGITVFLYEQIAAMLYNMSLNKKCHSHLANAGIINFITYAYETEFYKSYNSRGESEAQKRCIKTILHTLTRLVKDSVLGMELLEQQKHLPSSLVLKLNTTQDANTNTSRDISLVVQQLLEEAKHYRHEQLQQQQQQQQQHYRQDNQETYGKKSKLQLQRQESYV
ncbi:hypothetical protein DOY81_002485 [Sarcophaga bullata]|nr:hypothetical protein DOY81_002485 [Sarcophaga bullata]